MTAEEPAPLIVEAMRKAAVGWLSIAGRPAVAAWLSWHGKATYLVHGGNEQPIDGLAEATQCTVTVRGDHGGRIVTWPASVHLVAPGTPEWDEIAPALALKRLNASDPLGAPARWASSAWLRRLVPTGPPLNSPDTPAPSGG